MKELKVTIAGRHVQRIFVSSNDKYGKAMIAYFFNSLHGQNVMKICIKNPSDVLLWFDKKLGTYVLQLVDCIIGNVADHYQSFHERYDILIQDRISNLEEIFVKKILKRKKLTN